MVYIFQSPVISNVQYLCLPNHVIAIIFGNEYHPFETKLFIVGRLIQWWIQDCCKIQDGAICDNSQRLAAVNSYHKELHLGCCSSPRYASVTNVVSRILVQPGGWQLTILSFFNTSWKVRITRLAKPNKLLINFLFDYNNVRAFEVFK